MLTPEYMRQITEGAESIAEQMHQDIIDAMVRRIMQRLGRGDDYLLTSTDKWMIDLLRDSGMLLMDIQEALAKRSGTMEEEIAAAMRDAGVQSLARDDAIYKKAGLSVPSLKQSPYILRLMQRDYEKTSGLWRNMTGTTAEASQRLFIDEMDKAYRMTATGAVSYTKAFGDAIDRIVRDGVKVQYPSGHTDTLETAALRALRTGIGQMSGDITVRRMEEMDWDIVLVSAHMGARPGDGGENPSNHAWWQGKYYSLAGKDKRFPLLREATGYGTGEGLMGWNCRHSFGSGTGDPKDNPFTRPDTEENKKAYRVQQNQRAIERGIRKLKRECMGLNSAIEACQDPAMKEQLQASYDEKAKQLKDSNKEYAEYCDKHGTKQLRERIQIARWNREQADEARKAAWREEKKGIPSSKLQKAAGDEKTTFNNESGMWPETGNKIQKERLSALEAYAKAKGIRISGFEQFDGDTELVESFIDSMSELIPETGKRNKPVRLQVSYKLEDQTYAITKDATITINGYAFRNKDVLRRDYADKVNDLWFAKGTDYNSIAVHEMAHVITNLRQLKYSGLFRAVCSGMRPIDIHDMVRQEIGEYATKNEKELIAEAFSAYKSGLHSDFILKTLRICGML